MSYIPRTCPNCGAALDPGERCDCLEKAANTTSPVTDKRLTRYEINAILRRNNNGKVQRGE